MAPLLGDEYMSRGVYMEEEPCAHCRRGVYQGNAVWNDGLPYHQGCWKRHLSNQIEILEKKGRLGKITNAEAKLLEDFYFLHDRERKAPKMPDIDKSVNLEFPIFKGNTKLALSHTPDMKKLTTEQSKDNLYSASTEEDKKQTLISDGKQEKRLGLKIGLN